MRSTTFRLYYTIQNNIFAGILPTDPSRGSFAFHSLYSKLCVTGPWIVNNAVFESTTPWTDEDNDQSQIKWKIRKEIYLLQFAKLQINSKNERRRDLDRSKSKPRPQNVEAQATRLSSAYLRDVTCVSDRVKFHDDMSCIQVISWILPKEVYGMSEPSHSGRWRNDERNCKRCSLTMGRGKSPAFNGQTVRANRKTFVDSCGFVACLLCSLDFPEGEYAQVRLVSASFGRSYTCCTTFELPRMGSCREENIYLCCESHSRTFSSG